MANHEFGAKLLTRIVLPDLAGIGEDLELSSSRISVPDYRRVGLQCGKTESKISLTRGVLLSFSASLRQRRLGREANNRTS
jgi:hypothetical protein